MSTLHLATHDDRPKLEPMIAAFHAAAGLSTTDAERSAALDILFSGEVQAALWLIGPRRSPVGYVAVSFGFSIELGGRDAMIDEFFIRQSVRGRGMGSQTLEHLVPMLKDLGVRAMHLEVDTSNARAAKLYTRAGFRPRDRNTLMMRRL